MQLIPAIDLMNGKIVRLSRGDPKTAKIYNQFGTPLEAAKRWREEGADKLHIIDLDAAFGMRNNHNVIRNIVAKVGLPIQVGGGIRSFQTAAKLLKTGISQLILGALAFSDEEVIGKIQKQFGSDSVIVALDNRDGRIMVEGWKTATAMNVDEALEKFTKLGVETFLITSISRDGMLSGPDLEILKLACLHSKAKVIAAGGIGSVNDLIALKRIGVEGVVIGKALYECKFTLREAIERIGA
jgi:phosphoribosylformimino-5-aminoimidazole carboxamide ribotide isomerase